MSFLFNPGNVEEKTKEETTALHTIQEENSSNHSNVESENQSQNNQPILPTKIPVLIWIMGKKIFKLIFWTHKYISKAKS